MQTWPTITVPPLVSAWEEGAAGDPAIRSPYEAGYKQTRARFTRVPWRWRVVYPQVTRTEKNNVVAHEKLVKVGSDGYLWTNPDTAQQHNVRLLSPIRYRFNETDAYWVIEKEIEEM